MARLTIGAMRMTKELGLTKKSKPTPKPKKRKKKGK